VVLSLAIVVAAGILAAPSLAFDEVFQQTYPLEPGGSFQLQNVNGSVQITGWDRHEVEVHAVKSARRNRADLERVQIEVEAQPDSVRVETGYPKDEGVEVYVEYRVRVPRHVALRRIATVNGSVHVTGVEATGELRSVNGNVEVSDSSGRLSAHTTNGNVRLELRQLEPGGLLSLDTVNGSVVLALPPDADAVLDARSVNGELRSELPATLGSSLGSREFHARLGAGGNPIRIRTVNGAIRVLPVRPIV
jgi:DUF4097 and DUF4098 domain-containing protein YvlB